MINGFCGSSEFIAICNSYGIQSGHVKVDPVVPEPVDDTPRGFIERFVKRSYSILLERGVDPTGLKDWSDALESGAAQAFQIIDGIVNSREWINFLSWSRHSGQEKYCGNQKNPT